MSENENKGRENRDRGNKGRGNKGQKNRGRGHHHGNRYNKVNCSLPNTIKTEIIDGQEVVVMPVDEFNKKFVQKRVSQKQKDLQENGIDLKYLNQVQYRKKEGTYSFKIFNIPNIEELKKLVDIQETFSVNSNSE